MQVPFSKLLPLWSTSILAWETSKDADRDNSRERNSPKSNSVVLKDMRDVNELGFAEDEDEEKQEYFMMHHIIKGTVRPSL